MLESFSFSSINPGKHLLVTGAVHGNEICGTKACERIISKIKKGDLKLKSGTLTLIPICNPKAYELNKRFFEINLNRVIIKHENPKLYEEKIANILIDFIERADYHLDLHSMHTNGTPFSFEDYDEQHEFAHIQGLEYVFIGWPNLYKTSNHVMDYTTQAYSHTVNTISTTVECGLHHDEKAIDVAVNCILRSLKYLDMIDSFDLTQPIKQKNVIMQKVVFKEKEGIFVPNKKDLDQIEKGEILVNYEDGTNLVADDDYVLIFPIFQCGIGEEWFYLGKIHPDHI